MKTKGTNFSTGPTTSCRHSKKTKLMALILELGLLLIVGTIKWRRILHPKMPSSALEFSSHHTNSPEIIYKQVSL